jgi:23S rRNA (cytosine1962-C5)-methyltransferase
MNFPTLKLKKNEDRRLRIGHLWVFSNEVDTRETPLNSFSPGQTVTVTSSSGEKLGNAYINPHALICARLFSHDVRQPLDCGLLQKKISNALQLRQSYFTKPYYRMVYGESDFIPGLIVDRFDNTLVVQTSTLGLDLLQSDIIATLDEVVNPEVIIVKNDLGSRKLESLESLVEVVKGNPENTLQVIENNTRFEFSALQGQKTGWFYDHRANRKSMQAWAQGKKVLDVFSYVGGWGIQAATAGATEIHCVESSGAACEFIEANARLNNVADAIKIIQQDAFDALAALLENRQKFDLIILDPPAFIKRKKDIKQGSAAYQRLNKLALKLLSNNGLLISASCSFHFPRNEHLKILRNAASKSKCHLQIVEENKYAPDHPVHPAIPETDYLTCFTLRASSE